jgi:hypothetical protein
VHRRASGLVAEAEVEVALSPPDDSHLVPGRSISGNETQHQPLKFASTNLNAPRQKGRLVTLSTLTAQI